MSLRGTSAQTAIKAAETAYEDTDNGQIILELPGTVRIPVVYESGRKNVKPNYVTLESDGVVAVFDELVDRNGSHEELPEASKEAILAAVI